MCRRRPLRSLLAPVGALLLAACGDGVHDSLEVRARGSDGRALALGRSVLLPRLGAPRELRPDLSGRLPRGADAFYAGDRVLGAAPGHAPFVVEVGAGPRIAVELEPAVRLRGVVDCARFPHLAGARLQVHGPLLTRALGPTGLASAESLLGLGATTLDRAAGFALDGLSSAPAWVELWAPEYWHGPLRLPFDEVWDPVAARIVFEGGGDDLVDLRGRVEPDRRGALPSSVELTLTWEGPALTRRADFALTVDAGGEFHARVGRRLLDRVALAAPGWTTVEWPVAALDRAPLTPLLRPRATELLAERRTDATRSRP